MARTVTKWNMSLKIQGWLADFAFWVVLFVTWEWFIAIWSRASGTFIYLGIGVPQSNCNITDSLLSEPDCGDAGNGSDDCGFTMCDMTDSTNIERGLSTHNLRSIWGKIRYILVILRLEFFILVINPSFQKLFGNISSLHIVFWLPQQFLSIFTLNG